MLDRTETLESLGDDVVDDDAELRCTGFRATGGGAFLEDPVVEVERRRADGGDGLLRVGLGDSLSLSEVCDKLIVVCEVEASELNGGGSLRVPPVVV